MQPNLDSRKFGHIIQVVILITLIGFLLLLLCWIKATRDRVVVAFEVAVATRKSIVLLDSLLSACWVGSRRILAVRRVYTSGARQRGSASYLSSYLTCLNTMALNGCCSLNCEAELLLVFTCSLTRRIQN